jgi:hypothetical protein
MSYMGKDPIVLLKEIHPWKHLLQGLYARLICVTD